MESPTKSAGDNSSQSDLETIRRERDMLLQRQTRVAELLNCPPEKIEHDVRNLLNELQLLRTIFERQEQDDASNK